MHHCTGCRGGYPAPKQEFHCLCPCSFTVNLSWHLVVDIVTSSCTLRFSLTLRCFIDPSMEGLLLFAILQGDWGVSINYRTASLRIKGFSVLSKDESAWLQAMQRLKPWFCGWRTKTTWKKQPWCPRRRLFPVIAWINRSVTVTTA